MDREISFRGKRLDNGEWVYGNLIQMDEGGSQSFIFPFYKYASSLACNQIVSMFMVAVDPTTVGQFTGRCDKNGKKIFEGDIVTYPDGDGGYEYCDETINSGVVTWGDESALFYITNNYSAEFPDMWDCVDEMEVIGNIHDNPELAKEEAK